MSLDSLLRLGFQRVATEFNTLRSQITTSLAGKVDTSDGRLTDARTPTGAAGGVLNGTYPDPGLDAVPFPPQSLTYAATVSADPTLTNNFDLTATGDITSLGVSATGAQNGQMVLIAVLASGADRAVTPATGSIGAQTIPSGEVGFFGFRYHSGLAKFVCIAYRSSAEA